MPYMKANDGQTNRSYFNSVSYSISITLTVFTRIGGGLTTVGRMTEGFAADT